MNESKRRRRRGGGRKRRPAFRPNARHHSPEPPGTLKPTSGILEILSKGFGFLRQASHCYQSDPEDSYVPAALIRRYDLKTGSELTGEHTWKKGRPQLQTLLTVDGFDLEQLVPPPVFSRLTSIDPIEKFRIADGNDASLRILDLITPVGKGQRGLIVASPRTGKTILLQKLGKSILEFHPEAHLIVLLVDERPEEVTEMKRTLDTEVIYSSNDQLPQRHVKVVEMVLERSRRLVERKRDVVILLDSLTRVARAYNSQNKGRGRTLSGGLGVETMAKPREFFGAARKIEEGGSLTIIATALIDTGSRMDDVIFEEFKGTGNMELILHRRLADRRVWPAVDINKSGTRKEEKLRTPEEQHKINLLRRALADQSPENALTLLLAKIEKTQSNQQFLSMLRV